MKKLILILIVGCVFAKDIIAVLELEQIGLTPQEATILTQRLTTELISLDKYQVVERNNMDKILKEQKFQHSGCTDSECAVEIGQLLNSDFIVIGSVNKFGKTYALDARLIDVGLGKGKLSAKFSMTGEVDALLTTGINSIAKQLCGMQAATTLKQSSTQPSTPTDKENSTFGFSVGSGLFNTEECQKCENSPFSMAIYFNFNKPLNNLQLEFSTITDFGMKINNQPLQAIVPDTTAIHSESIATEDSRTPSYFGIFINKYFFIQKFNYYLGAGLSLYSNPIPNRERLGLHTGINLQLLSISSMDLYIGGNTGFSIINNSNPILKFSILLTAYF